MAIFKVDTMKVLLKRKLSLIIMLVFGLIFIACNEDSQFYKSAGINKEGLIEVRNDEKVEKGEEDYEDLDGGNKDNGTEIDIDPEDLSANKDKIPFVFNKETFLVNEGAPILDIVWVIDNSYSMLDNQEKLSQNLSNFIESFIDKDIEFQMGVITTDASKLEYGQLRNDPYLLSKEHYLLGPNLFRAYFDGHEHSIQKYYDEGGSLDFNTMEKGVDYDFVRVGNLGSGNERGLLNAFNSYKYSDEFIFNEKIFNSDYKNKAWTIFIILSDEDDLSISTDSGYEDRDLLLGENALAEIENQVLQYLDSFKVKLKKGGRNERKLKFYSIVYKKKENIPPKDKWYMSEKVGHRYQYAAKHTGGQSFDISGEFGNILAQLGDQMLEDVKTTFSLKQYPLDSTGLGIQVRLDDDLLKREDWSYELNGNYIKILKDKINNRHQNIEIEYYSK